jgi:hypothetical protein
VWCYAACKALALLFYIRSWRSSMAEDKKKEEITVIDPVKRYN